MRSARRIAERLVAGLVTAMTQKQQKVMEVVQSARKVRNDLDIAYKGLLKTGQRVKYVEGVGEAVAEAIQALQEADLRAKSVVDRGNRFLEELQWQQQNMEEESE